MSANDEMYIRGLKRELAGHAKRNPEAADAILAELKRAGAGDTIRTAELGEPVKRKPGRPKKQAE